MKSAKIYSNDFNRVIGATKNFTSQNSAHKAHEFVKLEFCAQDNMMTAVAVDGYKLSVEHSVISDCGENFVCYVKSNIKLPSGVFATIEISDDSREAIIRCNGVSFGFDQPKDDKFDWESVIPKTDVTFKIGFNGNYLLQALQAAKISLGGGFKDPVVLEFRNSVSPVILRTNKSDIKMVLPIRIKDC